MPSENTVRVILSELTSVEFLLKGGAHMLIVIDPNITILAHREPRHRGYRQQS